VRSLVSYDALNYTSNSSRGETLVISAPHNPYEVTSNGSGVVYVFERRGAQIEHVLQLEAKRPTVGDYFGSSVALSDTQLLVGSAVDADSNLG
jgi:hypothetical protein